jgi:hypothetical protein
VCGSAAGAVLAAGAALLAFAWHAAPVPSPPLYDGLILPSEAYRYLNNPPGVTSKPPTSFTQSFPLTDGKSPAIAEATSESPAQAQLLVEGDSFVLPAGTTSVTVNITPVQPPAVPPTGGQLDGNVYRFSVSAGLTPLQLKPTSPATIVLRGPAGAPNPMMEEFDAGRWTSLTTTPVGSPDTYAANVNTLGDMALVASSAATTTGSSGTSGGGGGGSGAIIALIAGIAVLVIASAVIVGIRLRRVRAAPSQPRQRRDGPRTGSPPRRKPPRRR